MALNFEDLKKMGMLPRIANLRQVVDRFQRDSGVTVPYTDEDVLKWIQMGMDRMGMTVATMTPTMEPQVLIAALICSGMCSPEQTERANNVLKKIPLMPC